MIKSMTGFGRGESSDGKRCVVCEIKSVNHRYLDIYVKAAKRYAFAEDAVKKAVREVASRGKIEVYLSVEAVTEEDTRVTLNKAAAGQYVKALRQLQETFSLSGEISLDLIASQSDVLSVTPDIGDEEEVTRTILTATEKALQALDDMRTVEGEKLRQDIAMRGGLIRERVDRISARAPSVGQDYAARLNERIAELLGDSVEVPEDRILMEAAIFADKAGITEELVRLNSHIDQLYSILDAAQSSGKKLDFLVQEMNREANTIGAKANDLEITGDMLEIKSEVEKIREQVQNIE
ncbi:MAG: YicC/YloC family endoribonuclease [Anaerovoracaceae bacterium]|jgi:uncharacterized protein (TIGR00255 family)